MIFSKSKFEANKYRTESRKWTYGILITSASQLVNKKNSSNVFYKETCREKNTISTQNFRAFPEQNPQNSIFHGLFPDRKKDIVP